MEEEQNEEYDMYSNHCNMVTELVQELYRKLCHVKLVLTKLTMVVHLGEE